MNPLLYANLSRETFSETLSGNSYDWPDFVAGGQVHFGLRTAIRREATNSLRSIILVDLYATAGVVDLRPVTGTVRIKLGGDAVTRADGGNTTAQLAPGFSAADLQTALNALSDVGDGELYPEAEVTEDHGSYLIQFGDHATEVKIVAVENELEPRTLLRVVGYQAGSGDWVHALRFIQSPAAMADGAERVVPTGPSIEREVAGSEIDGVEVNEVQVLIRPTDFRGNYQFRRGLVRSAYLSRADGPAQIAAALAPLADEDGEFIVTNNQDSEALIEFAGEMGGTGQDLLEVLVPRAPEGDLWVTLDLDAPEFYALLREDETREIQLHVALLYRETAGGSVRRADFIDTVTARRGSYYEGLEIGKEIDFLTPGRTSYVPASSDQIITGQQHYVAAFPTAVDVGANDFTHTHQLGTGSGHWTVRENIVDGQVLQLGEDYTVEINSDDQFTLSLPDGNLLAEEALVVTFTTAGPASAFIDNLILEMLQVTGLVPALESLASRISALETSYPKLAPVLRDETLSGPVWSQPLDTVQVIYPLSSGRRSFITEWPATVAELRTLLLPGVSATILSAKPAAGSLFPAVLDAAAESLDASSYPAVTAYADRVFINDTGVTILTSNANGRTSIEVPVGGHLACNGHTWYAVEQQTQLGGDAENAWYPSEFVFELFRFRVSSSLLGLGRTLETFFAVELALLNANTTAQMVLEIETGQAIADTAPTPVGENIGRVSWDKLALSETIQIGRQPTTVQFGAVVTREEDATNETTGDLLELLAYRYGESVTGDAPTTANFWMRGTMRNFDLTDAQTDPRGYLAISGLQLRADIQSATAAGKFGLATISQ